MSNCPHCQGTGKVPDKEWRVRQVQVREVVVEAATREEAIEKAELDKAAWTSAVKTVAAPLKPRKLVSPTSVAVNEKSGIVHLGHRGKVLCGGKADTFAHRLTLPNWLLSCKLCKKCEKLAEQKKLFEERKVI